MAFTISYRVVSELAAMVALIVLNVIIGEKIPPYHRGFFCDDQTLRHPLKPSTVGSIALLFISVFIPAGLLFLLENIRHRAWNPLRLRFWRVLHDSTIGFFIGFLITFLMCSASKYSIGRLRPNFMDACKPMTYYNETACDGMTNVYVTNYTCTAGSGYLGTDIHESFYSGHSALSFHAMVYVAVVIQRVLSGRKWALLKILLQSAAILLASLVAYSRISDYWHHPVDVLIGSVVGTVTAVIVEYAFREDPTDKGGRRKGEYSENINGDVESTYAPTI